MAIFKCWCPELGGTEEQADEFDCGYNSPRMAAEDFVKSRERRYAEYPVGTGSENVLIKVRRTVGDTLFDVIVSGELVPVYNGRVVNAKIKDS